MRLSQLFTKTSKTVPADETARNAKLLIQAGFIYKEIAGVYAYLPLGLRVAENIKTIVREEMDALGGQELIMTSLQQQDLWEKTDRWNDQKVDIWFKSQLKNGTEVGFGWSHEEQITNMLKNFVFSYRDLPVNVYQFQTKLRNELRVKSGIMRGREFVMNDMYSFSRNDEEHQKFYDAVTQAYLRIFERIGLGRVTFLTFASGGSFTDFSHEFQTITDAGEDTIYIDRKKKTAVNEEVMSDKVLAKLDLKREDLEKVKAAEVGNIFSFGTTKSKQLGLYFTDEDGKDKAVVIGSYGIGITRIMGVVVEHFADDKGLVWPANIAPAIVYIARLGNSKDTINAADDLYQTLTDNNIETIYDDRDVRSGEKFADADLMGIPYRIVVSDKTVTDSHFELKKRTETDIKMIPLDELLKIVASTKTT